MLTSKQRELLLFIHQRIKEGGVSPSFDEMKEGDEKFTFGDNLTVLVDPMSINFLTGSVVDYVDDFRGAGFIVKNPNATTTCGCGHSFSV